MASLHVSPLQQTSLVILRTLVGWHFLYEGYTKLLHPAWSLAGAPLPSWSSAAYLKAATGPLAPLFHWMGSVVVDRVTRSRDCACADGSRHEPDARAVHSVGCGGALALLVTFYLAAMPTGGIEVRAEGTYLLVNKNLVEACAVLVLLAFRTGSIAGLDRLWLRARPATIPVQEAVA